MLARSRYRSRRKFKMLTRFASTIGAIALIAGCQSAQNGLTPDNAGTSILTRGLPTGEFSGSATLLSPYGGKLALGR